MKKHLLSLLTVLISTSFALSAQALDTPVMNTPASPDADGTFTVSWNVVAGASNYEVFEFDDDPPSWAPGTFRQIQVWGGNNTSLTRTKTTDGTWYYRVRSWANQGGWIHSSLSNPRVEQVVQINNADLPKPPPTLHDPNTPDSDGTYTINWDTVPGASSYEVFEFDDDPPSWQAGTFRQIQVWGGSSDGITRTKTEDGTWYYRVRTWSQDSQGNWIHGSLNSSPVAMQVVINDQDTPKPPPTLHAPVTPDNDGTYTINWDTVPGASSYEVFEFDDNPPSWAAGTFRQIQVWGGSSDGITRTKTEDGTWYYRVRTWSQNTQGQWIHGSLNSAPVAMQVALPAATVLSQAQQDKLEEYASKTVRYFTAPNANNKQIGFTHAAYGKGDGRSVNTNGVTIFEVNDTGGFFGSHVNINEVTLRFLSLAAAYKMGWLDADIPDSATRYAESWGQIKKGLETMKTVITSSDPQLQTQNNFYRGYHTANTYTWNGGGYAQDRTLGAAEPYKFRYDFINEQSSDDNGLPFMNLLTLEGMAQDPDVVIMDSAAIVSLCQDIRDAINLERFLVKDAPVWMKNEGSVIRDVIVHNYLDGKPSLTNFGRGQGIWDRSGAEGSLIAAAMLLSGDIDLDDFNDVASDSLIDWSTNWNSFGEIIPIDQTTYHAALFIHGLRSLHGIPVTPAETAGADYYAQSLKPIFDAHLDWADEHGKNAIGSQAMTQGLKGYPMFNFWNGTEFLSQQGQVQFPGNEDNSMPIANQVTGVRSAARSTAPHAFFVPLSRANELDSDELDWIFDNLALYEAEFFHDGSNASTELGWEAVIPWTPGDTSATWRRNGTGRVNYSDQGRPYEALNAAYTVLHIFDALNPDKPLAAYNVEAERLGKIAAFFDSGVPLDPSDF